MLFRSNIKVVYRLREQIFPQPGWKFVEYGVSDLVVEFHGSRITGLGRLSFQIPKARRRGWQHILLSSSWSIFRSQFVLRGRRKD